MTLSGEIWNFIPQTYWVLKKKQELKIKIGIKLKSNLDLMMVS